MSTYNITMHQPMRFPQFLTQLSIDRVLI